MAFSLGPQLELEILFWIQIVSLYRYDHGEQRSRDHAQYNETLYINLFHFWIPVLRTYLSSLLYSTQ